ncbi:MAG: MFS transporter [Truepera sp.]|nr:MFS transporter [Truepera sp.]
MKAARPRLWVRNLFVGWWLLGAAVAVQVLPASFLMHSYSAYAVVMQPEFGWSITVFATAFSAQQVAGGFLGPFQGWLLLRFGPQRMIRVGLVIFALGLALLSQVRDLPLFYIALLIASFGGSLGGFLSLNTAVVNWFIRHRSLALAMIQIGVSVGGLIAPAIAWSLTTQGWRFTALASAVLTLLVGLPLTILIRDRPEDLGLVPDGTPIAAKRPTPVEVEFDAREALRTRAFWFLSLGQMLSLIVVSAVLAHLVLYLSEEANFTLALAATMVMVITASTIFGQLASGFLGDSLSLSKRTIATLAMFGHAGALLMLAYAATLPWVVAFAVVHGLSSGLRGPALEALRADYFGRRSFAQILGFASPLITIGAIAGPLIVGFFADNLGSFKPGFAVVAGLALLGSVFFMLAQPPVKRSRPSG